MDVNFTITREDRYIIERMFEAFVRSTCTGEVADGVYDHMMTREEVEFLIKELRKARERDYRGLAFFELQYEQAQNDADPYVGYVECQKEKIQYVKADIYRIDTILRNLHDAICDAEAYEEMFGEKKEETK